MRAEHDRHLVHLDQLVDRVHRDVRVVGLVVLEDDLQRLAENAAAGIDLCQRELDALLEVAAEIGARAGQRGGGADHDLRLCLRRRECTEAGGDGKCRGGGTVLQLYDMLVLRCRRALVTAS